MSGHRPDLHRRAKWASLFGLIWALSGDATAGDDLWVVSCNTDCDGQDTCADRKLCTGEETQTTVCADNPRCPASKNDKRCEPKPCIWGEWTDWFSDGSSGLCSRNRTFTPNRCGGQPCMGSTSDTKYCKPDTDPPVDCEFSSWSEWGLCDQEILQRTRHRSIKTPAANHGEACNGPLSQTESCGDRRGPVDCELTEWMSWSGCTRSCGGGQQMRVRAVLMQAEHGGRLCQGDDGMGIVLQTTRACNSWECANEAGAVDCQVGPWAEWSDCSGDEHIVHHWEARGVSATRTQKFRKRVIVAPASRGGFPCHEKLEETAACKDFAADAKVLVKADCQLSQWASWTLCDRTCDGGQTYRQRSVKEPAKNGGKPCEDLMSETMPCNEIPCKVDPEGLDCQLSTWSHWSACSALCGQGVEERQRSILVPAQEGGRGCNDILHETRPCEHVEPCAQTDCAWSLWTQWGACTATCSGGHRKRFRHVAKLPSAGGRKCHAHDSISEVEPCAESPCPDECTDGEWGQWTEWGHCSLTCGGGLQWRHRQIVKQPSLCGMPVSGKAEELRKCSTEPCEGDRDCDIGGWSMWSACSRSCDGVQSRKRRITTSAGRGRECEKEKGEEDGRALEEVRSCNAPNELLLQAEAPGFADIIEACGYGEPVNCHLGSWSKWSPCTKVCGGGDRTRNRTIVQQPRNGGQPCGGSLGQIGVCNTVPCDHPKDCKWTEWSSWGTCTKCDGEKTRLRAIAERGNALGKPCELSASKEVAQCNECLAVRTFWCVWADWSDGSCSATCGSGLQKRTRALLKTDEEPKNASHAVGTVSGQESTCSGSETDYSKCKDNPICADDCQPRDCSFSQWSEWSDAHCNGLCRRQRSIETQSNECGRPCKGLLESTKSCKSECTGESDCQVSAWSEWTPCPPSGGQRKRIRRILAVPGPLGKSCTGDLQETKPCKSESTKLEQADCEFGEWGEWTECSSTCGGGQHERHRRVSLHATLGGEACKGALSMTAACSTHSCPAHEHDIDCVIGQWSQWSGCDASDDTQAYRTRALSPAVGNGLPCEGAIKESGECPKAAPVHCTFEDWAPWGDCDNTCGGGQRFRTRQVASEAKHGGRPCEGFLDQSEPCNEEPCNPDLDCAVSSWNEWSSCDVKCGTGVQQRERKVVRGAGPGGAGCGMGLKEVRGCRGSDCIGDQDCQWGSWNDWGGCERAVYCGMGFRKRTRHITMYPQGDGRLCDPLTREEVMPSSLCVGNCDREVCIDGEWGEWGHWGACSVTCGSAGVRMRSRWEKVKANYCGKPAEGDRQRFKACSADAACEKHEQDCGFDEWGPWEKACSSWCNGIKTRKRGYSLPSGGGKSCRGSTMESVRCNPGPGETAPVHCESGAPVDCQQAPWSEWSACSAKCGNGHKFRRREVLQPPSFGGKDCKNPYEEIKDCAALLPCPDSSMDCAWGEWEAWTSCDPVLGQRLRRRHVRQPKVGLGLDCAGSEQEAGACPRDCPDRKYLCMWSDWRPWSACSTTCGGEGRMTRTRSLTVSPVPPEGSTGLQLERTPMVMQRYELPVPVFDGHRAALSSSLSSRPWELVVAFSGGMLGLASMLVGARSCFRHLAGSRLHGQGLAG